jgi:hypothetical protein
VTHHVVVSEGKRTDEGTMMWPRESGRDLKTVADPFDAQTSTSATTKEASDIVTNSKIDD